MASEWIKIEKTTPDKPEMRSLAKLCGVSKGDAFLGFFQLWSCFDDHCADGFIPHLDQSDIDEMSGIQGMGGALSQIGWLSFDKSGVTIINWERHNGKSGKTRALANRRKASQRERDKFATESRNQRDKYHG